MTEHIKFASDPRNKAPRLGDEPRLRIRFANWLAQRLLKVLDNKNLKVPDYLGD